MKNPKLAGIITSQHIQDDLADIGIAPGDRLMVHASLRSIGRILGGPDSFIDAILERIGPSGTLLAYADWENDFAAFTDPDGVPSDEVRLHVRPFDPATSRAARYVGSFAELLRTRPGALRSANPGASMVALGGNAPWFTAGHRLDYGYGPDTPFAKLVEAGGKVAMIGAPLGAMTLLHHAEHLADIPAKRLIRGQVPIRTENGIVWQDFEEFDTSDPVVEGLKEDYFAEIVSAFIVTGRGRRGRVGNADTVVVDAQAITRFAVDWLEACAKRHAIS